MNQNNKNFILFIILGIFSGLLSVLSNINKDKLIIITSILLPVVLFLSYKTTDIFRYIKPKQYLFLGLILFTLEVIGSKTGVIYGDFVYGKFFNPQVYTTPIIMLFIWATLIIDSYNISQVFKSNFLKVIFSAIFLVLLDLVIDPGAAHMGLWSWVNGGIWYGIPISNYVGWLGLGTFGAFILVFLNKNKPNFAIKTLPNFYIYTLTFWSVYNAMIGFYKPAIIGFILIIITILILRQRSVNTLQY